jgi:hypothetical protein
MTHKPVARDSSYLFDAALSQISILPVTAAEISATKP